MNTPKKSLAMSLSILLTQAGWVGTQPANAADAIWQKLSSSSEKKTAKKKVRKPQAKKKVAIKKQKTQINDDHVMLLLGNDDDTVAKNMPAPAAALSIHPSLNPIEIKNPNAPSLVAFNGPVPGSTPQLSAGKSDANKQLIAQLAPDQVIAQSTSSDVTATPIPPVVTGTVDMEEFKTTNVIDLKVSQSRTFKLRNKIVRTSISDPGIAEPVVVAENQMVLLGKAPGSATMVIWDDAGNTTAIDILVDRDFSELQTSLREIDPRIIVKAFSVGGSDRVLLMGDVDHPESVIRAFMAANVFMDDRGMNIQVAGNRLINARIGEIAAQGGVQGGGGGTGVLSQLANVDRFTFFPNLPNNISKGQVITSDGGRVTSLVKVRKVPLIILHCTFMEMNTNSARELATAIGFTGTSDGFAFGVGGTNQGGNFVGGVSSFGGITQRLPTFLTNQPNPLAAAPLGTTGSQTSAYSIAPNGFIGFTGVGTGTAQAIGQPVLLSAPPSVAPAAVLFGAPGGASFSPGGLVNLFTATSTFPSDSPSRFSIQPTIQGIISQNRARVLSEPSLVTISGERAAFLAGGEIPLIQSVAAAGQAQQSIVFEPFGLRLNFIPVLMENGAINLEIAPEERIPSLAVALNVPGSNTNIPGFTTRKAQTIVEMKPGQELFIGGLVTTNNGRELVKLPIIGEIPILGAMYRSKAFAKNESELVIAIRPEVILPGTPGQLKLPEEIGRVEGPRDTNMFQVEPTIIDERHYSSGRAERHQKTSPTLPEGAPIPDNN